MSGVAMGALIQNSHWSARNSTIDEWGGDGILDPKTLIDEPEIVLLMSEVVM